jgi:chromosome segregation ATPase
VHEAHALELGGVRRERDNAMNRRHALESDLAAARAEAETLHDQLDDREDLIERARAEAAAAGEEAAAMHAAAERLRDAIEARADAGEPQRRLEDDADEIEHLREELRVGVERLAALERQAQTLRDAIQSELPPSAHPSPLQEALPLL